jgi:hypothetical protein
LPFESPESRRWKFAWLNALSVRRAKQLFSQPEKYLVTPLPDGWEVHSNADVLSRAWLSGMLGKDARMFFEMDVLRYCPICLSAGYHSWWHQCLLHSSCLAHACRLTSGCQCCGKNIDIYGQVLQKAREPYICGWCLQPFAGVELDWQSLEDLYSIRPILVERYSPWAYWLSKQLSMQQGWDRVAPPSGAMQSRMDRDALSFTAIVSPPTDELDCRRVRVCARSINLWCSRNETFDWIPRAVGHCPETAMAAFCTTISRNFGPADWKDFERYREPSLNGFRIRAPEARVAPLALAILQIFCEYWKPYRRALPYGRQYVSEDNELWVARLVRALVPSYFGCWMRSVCWTDEDGLRQLFEAVYAELYAWLACRKTRACFDLEVGRLNETPGLSVYRTGDDGESGDGSMILLYPLVPGQDERVFALQGMEAVAGMAEPIPSDEESDLDEDAGQLELELV